MTVLADTAETLKLAEPIGPQVLSVLRKQIVHNHLHPGRRISEAEIAAHHGVSRQPVREAFIKLAEEGLVEVRPQRGTYVRKISMDAVMGARFVREAVEADIVKLLAEIGDVALVAALRSQIDLQTEAAERDPETFIALDEAFHRTLADAAGMAFAWRTVETSKVQMDRVRYLSFLHFPMANLVAQHRLVVDAIAERNPQAAERAMRTHLQEILKDLPIIAAAHPGFFDRPTGTIAAGRNPKRLKTGALA